MFELRPFLKILGHVIIEPGCFLRRLDTLCETTAQHSAVDMTSPGVHLTHASLQPGEPSRKGTSPPTLV